MGEEDALDRVQVVVASEEVGVEAEGGKFLVKAAKKVVEVVEAEVEAMEAMEAMESA